MDTSQSQTLQILISTVAVDLQHKYFTYNLLQEV